MTADTNQQWLLASRPTGTPTMDCFERAETPVPEPGPGEVLVRTQYLSVDPYMRGRMRAGESYADPWPVGEPMRARCVAEVVESNHEDLAVGDTVRGNLYWAEYAAVDGDDVERVDTGQAPASTALHVLGMPGRTAYAGTVDVGAVEPGDTVVVSAAGGAVGLASGDRAGAPRGGWHAPSASARLQELCQSAHAPVDVWSARRGWAGAAEPRYGTDSGDGHRGARSAGHARRGTDRQ